MQKCRSKRHRARRRDVSCTVQIVVAVVSGGTSARANRSPADRPCRSAGHIGHYRLGPGRDRLSLKPVHRHRTWAAGTRDGAGMGRMAAS